MSQLPTFKATLEDNLNNEQRAEVLDKLKALKGVLGAHFKHASNKEIYVTHLGASSGAFAAAKKVPGVKTVQKYPC